MHYLREFTQCTSSPAFCQGGFDEAFSGAEACAASARERGDRKRHELATSLLAYVALMRNKPTASPRRDARRGPSQRSG